MTEQPKPPKKHYRNIVLVGPAGEPGLMLLQNWYVPATALRVYTKRRNAGLPGGLEGMPEA